jgi:hypothetical protein
MSNAESNAGGLGHPHRLLQMWSKILLIRDVAVIEHPNQFIHVKHGEGVSVKTAGGWRDERFIRKLRESD